MKSTTNCIDRYLETEIFEEALDWLIGQIYIRSVIMEKFLRDNDMIVIFCDSFKLRELKSGGNIMLSIYEVIGLDKAISFMRLQ